MGGDETKEKRVNQSIFNSSEIKEINRYLNKASRSVCKIETSMTTGTGFLIKLYKNYNNPLFCLMTNEHVIKRELIERKEIIEIYYDFGFKYLKIQLDRNKRLINEYTNINLDITIIEIIKEDNINEDYFLEPYLEYNNIKLGNNICILQYPNNLNYSKGNIININNYELSYDASTEKGSSGSPIILENTIQVIGIHKQGGEGKNYGDFIYPLFNILKNNNAEKKICENGEYFIGYWDNGISHGKGIIKDKNGNVKYDGDCINGNFEGYGNFYFKDGKVYKGQWKNDLQHGKGKLYDENGNLIYEGDFMNDRREGFGKYIWKNGEIYIGQWKNDLKHGKGKVYYKNGNMKFDGNFINDHMEGIGKYIWENGVFFIGQMKNDSPQYDKGKTYNKNGSLIR